MKLDRIGEFGLIDRIAARVGPARSPVVLGIGDDASIFRPGEGMDVVVTTDMLVEGVHFVRGMTPFADLGYKSLAVNLSDLAAMGAEPIQAFLSLGLPPGTETEEVDAFMDGFLEAASLGIQLSGGDTVSCPDRWAVSVTALGQVPKGAALLRSGARPGDEICVTGPLGGSAAGLHLLLAKIYDPGNSDHQLLVDSHNRPTPQLSAGRELLASGLCRCAIDVSDGFLQDLGHICRESQCGAVVDLEDLPVSPAAVQVATEAGRDPWRWPLTGGEDYQLIYTAAAGGAVRSLERSLRGLGLEPVRVGSIVKGSGIELRRQGRPCPIPAHGGHDHFQKD